MNKSELVRAVEDRLQTDRKTAANAVDSVIDLVIRSVVKGEKVSITGFGVFERRRRSARTARNPATGASVKVKATSVPAFRAGAGFKEFVSGAKKLTKSAPVAKSTATKATATKATATKATTAKAAGSKATAGAAKKATTTRKAAASTGSTTAKKATTARKAAASTGSTAAKKGAAKRAR